MIARPNQTLWVDITARLERVGFRKRAGELFTREVSEDVLGWVGLNSASRHTRAGEFEVNPVIGIRHQKVERVVAELRAEKFHQYVPPTVSVPLGYLMPAARYHAWVVGGAGAGEVEDDLVAAIAEYGLPFMEAGSTLPALCGLIDQGLGFDHQLVYRRPVAWLLARDRERAVETLDRAEATADGRADAAAVELRAFVAAFRTRFLLSSSD